MRLREIFTVSTCVLLLLGWVPWVRAESYPYKTYVTAENVPVRSGPGHSYYATDELSRGEEVEVYWEYENGWFAIRPPAGSFSWVPSKALRREENERIAEIVEDQIPAQIGSQINNERSATQVRLHVGELVTIQGSRKFGNITWYKIEPPSGEFRWLHKNTIDIRPLEVGESLNELVFVPQVPIPSEQNNKIRLTTATAANDDSPSAVWTARRTPQHGPPHNSHESSWHALEKNGGGKSRKQFDNRSDRPSINEESISYFPSETSSPDRSQAPTTSLSAIQELQLHLSRLAANPPQTRQLEALRRQARQIADEGKSSQERAQARLIIEEIAKFEDIQLRHEQLEGLPVGSGIPSKTTVSAGEQDQRRLEPADTFPVRYDGSGWLMPVISRRKNVPQYALTDDYGRILKFVIPAPGLNLRRYLRKQIGISGSEQMNPALFRPQLMAERVVMLDRHRR